MKGRSIHIILLLSICGSSFGQLLPLLNQYHTNGLAINPAYAGSQDALQIELNSRKQWVGFEGAPSTLTISIHGPVGKKKVNLGIIVMSDKYGSHQETGFLFNYAYRIGLGNGDLSMGLAAGITSFSSDMDAFIDIQMGDRLLQDPGKRAYLPEFSLGSYYQSDRFFVGLSLPLFISHPLSASSNGYSLEFSLPAAHYFLSGGILVKLSENIELLPSFLLKSHPASSTQLDMNCTVILREKIWLGSSIMTNGSISAILQFQVNPQIRIGYTYGYEISELSKYQRGSHEVTLSYGFKYMLEVIGPRYF